MQQTITAANVSLQALESLLKDMLYDDNKLCTARAEELLKAGTPRSSEHRKELKSKRRLLRMAYILGSLKPLRGWPDSPNAQIESVREIVSTLLPMCSRIDRERFLHPFAGNTVKGSQTIEDLKQDVDRFGSVLYSFAAENACTLQINLTSLVNDLAAGVATAPNRRSMSATMFGVAQCSRQGRLTDTQPVHAQRDLLEDFDEILSETSESTAVMTPTRVSSVDIKSGVGASRGDPQSCMDLRSRLLASDSTFFGVDLHMQQSLSLLVGLGYSSAESVKALFEWLNSDSDKAVKDLAVFMQEDRGAPLPVYARKILQALRG